MELTPEQRQQGKANFETLVGYHGQTRREFMQGVLAAGAVLPLTAAAYFGYRNLGGEPVRAALIGAGDQGGVLVGEHNPEFLRIVAVCDPRPTNQKRIFTGESSGPRKGLNRVYGEQTAKEIAVTDKVDDVLSRNDIEAVIIALPLHLHASIAIAALNAGKHVFCEKLMAWNVAQCKEMIRVAEGNDRVLAIGHQRHYSLLYAYAQDLVRSGELGHVNHIRAFWHRLNAEPVLDAAGQPRTEQAVDHRTGKPIPGVYWPVYRDSWRPPIAPADREALESRVRALGYHSMEELVRWRLYQRTGGGLMAELGSHQLDACSIFLGKARPLAVSGVGGRYFYRDDREAEDHVFCTFEFPGKNYWKDQAAGEVGDKDDRVIVTYSSVNTSRFEPYGEWVMGTRGTLLLEREEEALVIPSSGRSTAVVASAAGAGKPAADASATWAPSDVKGLQQQGKAILGSGPTSKGYREELEHFAYCVKMWSDKNVAPHDRPRPRCEGTVAMADAIIALTANLAMRGTPANGNQPRRIEFQPSWYDPKSSDVPEGPVIPRQPNA